MKTTNPLSQFIRSISEDIQNHFYKYFIITFCSSFVSVLVTIATTSGTLLTLPEKVEAVELQLEEIEKFNEKQTIINERQMIINENIDKNYSSIDNKLNILIQR